MNRIIGLSFLKRAYRYVVGKGPLLDRSSTSKDDDDHVERFRGAIGGDRRVNIRKITDEVEVSEEFCNQILIAKLHML